MKFTFSQLSVLLLVSSVFTNLSLGQSDSNWPGFRGLSAQGNCGLEGPTKWSAGSSNVRWKTILPGEGHSSPVVVGNRVIVTAAYPTTNGKQIRLSILCIILGLAFVLVCMNMIYLYRLCRHCLAFDKGQFISICLYSMILGLFLHALILITIQAYSSDHTSRYMLWLWSHLLAGIGIALVANLSIKRVYWRILLSAMPFLLMFLLIWFRPNPEYYVLTHSVFHLVPTYTVLAILTFIGVTTVVTKLIKRSKTDLKSERQADSMPPKIRFLYLAIAYAVFMGGISGFGAINWLDSLVKHGWLPSGNLVFSRVSIPIAGCAVGMLLWCSMMIFRSNRSSICLHLFFPLGVLILIGLTFLSANFIGFKDDYARAIICIDRDDGKIMWTCEGLHAPKQNTHIDNSLATPTPVVTGQRVFAYFGTPGLMCTDLEGNLVWSNRNLPYEGIHGVGSSLTADSGCIFVTSLNAKAPYITALDCLSGKRIWTVNLKSWRGIHGEYRTPIISSLHGKKVLINWFRTHNELAAYNVYSGEELWKITPEGTFVGEAVASILVSDNAIYLPSRSDFVAMSIKNPADKVPPKTLWKTNMRGRGPLTASPVLSNSMIFMVSDSGFASCLDASTGDLLWQERLPRGVYLASPIVTGNYVYFWNTSGVTTVVACGRKFKKIAENSLPGGIYATPAPVDGQLFIRTTEALWCIK